MNYRKGLFLFIFSFIALSLTSVSLLHAGESWDNFKKKARLKKQKTKLKMKRSHYKDKIKEEYTRLGELIYQDSELKKLISANASAQRVTGKIDLYFKKIKKFEEKIAIIDQGEEVTNEEIEAIEEGYGLDESPPAEADKKGASEKPSSSDTPADDSPPQSTSDGDSSHNPETDNSSEEDAFFNRN